MIVQLVGTNGSGKSTIVQAFLDAADKVEPEMIPGRAFPWTYLVHYDFQKPIRIIGAYGREREGGRGFDSLKMPIGDLYKMLDTRAKEGDLLFEGAAVMNMQRSPDLARAHSMTVLLLTTPLATCFEGINTRRADAGKTELDRRRNVEGNHTRALNYSSVLRKAGARVVHITRQNGLEKLREAFFG